MAASGKSTVNAVGAVFTLTGVVISIFLAVFSFRSRKHLPRHLLVVGLFLGVLMCGLLFFSFLIPSLMGPNS